MKKLLIALCLAVGFASPAFAADEKAPTTQQTKMATCNKEAGEKALKGDERKKFMSDCLSAKPAKAESKMSMCNKQTAGLSGDARSKAQSECMKGPATAAAPAKAAAAPAKAP